MSKEASWIAAVLAGLLLLMAFLAPARDRGDLPVLGEIERPIPVISHVPLVGPIIGRVQRQLILVTWRLDSIPIE
jgi:hypothetical protein